MPPKVELITGDPEQSFVFVTHGHPYPLCVWHYHPQIEIHLIHNGIGQALIGDYIGDFAHGHLVMAGPNLPHNWHSTSADLGPDRSQKDYVIQFSPELINATIGTLPEAAGINKLLAGSKHGLEFYGAAREKAECLIVLMEHASGFERLLLLLQLLQVLSKADGHTVLASGGYLPDRDPQTASQIESIVRFVRANYDRSLTQPEVASRFNMTPATFSRFFKKNIGRGFVRYLNAIRVGEACSLLMAEELTVAEVAFNVGFNNLSNFNRRFIEEKGIPPREYRFKSRVRVGDFAHP